MWRRMFRRDQSSSGWYVHDPLPSNQAKSLYQGTEAWARWRSVKSQRFQSCFFFQFPNALFSNTLAHQQVSKNQSLTWATLTIRKLDPLGPTKSQLFNSKMLLFHWFLKQKRNHIFLKFCDLLEAILPTGVGASIDFQLHQKSNEMY